MVWELCCEEFDWHADICNLHVGSGSFFNVQALKAETLDQTGLVIYIEV